MKNLKTPQDIVKQILYNGFVQKQSHHLYILVAPNLSQQREVYQWFIKLHVCENREEETVCNTCNACVQVDTENYLNSVIIRKQDEKKSIGVDEVGVLQEAFATTAGLDAKRFFCIEMADIMTVQAANSILKFLEEPLGDVCGFLFVSNEHKLLPTITSRGQILRLGDAPLSNEIIKEIEIKFTDVTYQHAATYLCINNYDKKQVFKYLQEMMETISSYAAKLAVGSPLIVAQTELEQFASKTKTGVMILDLFSYVLLQHYIEEIYFKNTQPQVPIFIKEHAVEIFLSIYDSMMLTKTHASISAIMTKFTLELLNRMPYNKNN